MMKERRVVSTKKLMYLVSDAFSIFHDLLLLMVRRTSPRIKILKEKIGFLCYSTVEGGSKAGLQKSGFGEHFGALFVSFFIWALFSENEKYKYKNFHWKVNANDWFETVAFILIDLLFSSFFMEIELK